MPKISVSQVPSRFRQYWALERSEAIVWPWGPHFNMVWESIIALQRIANCAQSPAQMKTTYMGDDQQGFDDWLLMATWRTPRVALVPFADSPTPIVANCQIALQMTKLFLSLWRPGIVEVCQ